MLTLPECTTIGTLFQVFLQRSIIKAIRQISSIGIEPT